MSQLRGSFKGSSVKFNFSKIIDFGMVLDPGNRGWPFALLSRFTADRAR